MEKQEEQVIGIYQKPKQRRRAEPANLADCVKELMDRRISLAQSRFGPVIQHWRRILPAELEEHCKIQSVSSGQLKVLVDSPSYMQELQLCSQELLEELQKSCPQARIQKIKFVIG